MEISARVASTPDAHTVQVRTDAAEKALAVPAKAHGGGSAINGGEFLMLALATCYCNDLYREAARLGISLDAVDVEARADFPGIGLAACNVSYRAWVRSAAPAADIERLLAHTDAVAEVHNTLRAGVPVEWAQA
jgi:organic hydroperoxide reductase OsmC/OhrA